MSVPNGFKQTEVGVIPQDWEVETISGIASVKTGPFGSLLHEKDYVSSGTPIITVEHLGEYGITNENTPNVSDSDKSRLKEYILCKHDIVFSRVGSIDRSALVGDHETGWLFSGRLLRVRVITRRAKPTYLNYHFKSESFRKKIYSVAVGQTMASLNTEILKRVMVPLPPPAEQTAIATALSDIDALIEGVEKLLEKKRRIKQGAMQELLRPKEGWIKNKLGELFEITAGGDVEKEFFSHRVDEKYPYPIYSNSLSNYGLYGYSSFFTSESNCITVTARGTIGYACFRDHRFSAIGRLLVLRPKSDVDCFYLSEFINNKIEFALEVTGVPQLTAPQISKYEVWIPDKKSEQTAIAAILSDMDSEIQQLETQLTKYRQLKTGMMQELLTGKKRLV